MHTWTAHWWCWIRSPYCGRRQSPSLPFLSGRTELKNPLCPPLAAPGQTQPSGGPGFLSAWCLSLKTVELQTPPNTGALGERPAPLWFPPPSYPLRGGGGQRMKGRLPRLTQPPASLGQTLFFILSDFIMRKCQSLRRSHGLGGRGWGKSTLRTEVGSI